MFNTITKDVTSTKDVTYKVVFMENVQNTSYSVFNAGIMVLGSHKLLEMISYFCKQTMVQHCSAVQCTVLHCTALHCSTLHCTALHYTALHYTTL